jgi:dolichol-phosphate mannosyltransferase
MNKSLSIILPVYNEKESLAIMVRLLKSTLKFENEILIIYDSLEDNCVSEAKKLEKEIPNVRAIHNDIQPGVKFAVEKGIKESKYDIIFVTAVDEIFPIIAIDEMINLIVNDGFEFISGTRYSKGGKRIGGSLLGSVLSKTANKLFKIFTNFPLSDCTTGIKMMRKNVWNSISLESNSIGWAFAFELTIKVYLNNFKIEEVPLKSVDRLFGGSSTFKPLPWIKEYLKWFLWGIKKVRKIK